MPTEFAESIDNTRTGGVTKTADPGPTFGETLAGGAGDAAGIIAAGGADESALSFSNLSALDPARDASENPLVVFFRDPGRALGSVGAATKEAVGKASDAAADLVDGAARTLDKLGTRISSTLILAAAVVALIAFGRSK